MKHLSFLLLLGLVSCMAEIELEQPPYEPKVVVDGTIESNGFAQVFLTESSPFLTQYDSISIRESFLNEAAVRLTCSNGDTEMLTLFRQSQFFPPFVYKSTRMKGIVGESYTLSISYRGEEVTAITSIPEPPVLLGFNMEHKSDSSGVLKVEIVGDTLHNQYLYLQYKSFFADQNMHPAGVPVFKIDAGERVVSVALYRCNETNLYLDESIKTVYTGWPSTYFSKKDTILVRVGKVDAPSYQILKSLFADQSVKNNPFAFNSEGIQSNVKGGIGRWTGVGVAAIQVYP